MIEAAGRERLMTPVNQSSDPLQAYRSAAKEKEREASLLRLVGTGATVLEVGARDGHYTRLLQARFFSSDRN